MGAAILAIVVIVFLGIFLFYTVIDILPVIGVIAGVFVLICAIVGISENIKSKREERERNLAESIRQQINVLIFKYKPAHTFSVVPPALLSVDVSFLNRELINITHSYKAQLIDIIEEKTAVDEKLDAILKHNEHEPQDEYVLDFLNRKETELIALKAKSDECHRQIERHKIELLNENDDLMFAVKTAFLSLLSSKKCTPINTKTDVKSCVTKSVPKELSMFQFGHDPVVLFIESFYFCLFSNSILVFDSNGTFSTALDPTTLKVHIETKQTQIHVNDNQFSFNQYTASDSKCIRRGETRHTWLHTRLDGSPDLRYRSNPRIDYRTDIYEYVVLTITIANKSVSFNVSSHNVASMFNAMLPKYIRRCNNQHEPIPEFLCLLKSVLSNENPLIDELIEAVNSNSRNFFCRIADTEQTKEF